MVRSEHPPPLQSAIGARGFAIMVCQAFCANYALCISAVAPSCSPLPTPPLMWWVWRSLFILIKAAVVPCTLWELHTLLKKKCVWVYPCQVFKHFIKIYISIQLKCCHDRKKKPLKNIQDATLATDVAWPAARRFVLPPEGKEPLPPQPDVWNCITLKKKKKNWFPIFFFLLWCC